MWMLLWYSLLCFVSDSIGHNVDYRHRTDLTDLSVDESSQRHPDHGPYPWGDVFHYPYFQFQKSILSHQWHPITYEEMHRYYNAYETCVILANNPDYCTLTDYTHNDIGGCSIYDRGEIYPQDASCPNLRGNFIKHESTKPWPDNKHIIDIMATMLQHGSNLVYFIGDSVTGQHYSETYCSLLRMGLTFIYADKHLLIVKNPNNDIHAYSNNKPYQDKDYNDSIHRYFVFRFIKHDRNGDTDTPLESVIDEIENNIKIYNNKKLLILFIINIGLHYNYSDDIDMIKEEKVMSSNMLEYFTYFKSLSQQYQHIVIFRETSAQHFHTSNGMYESQKSYIDYTFQLFEQDKIDNVVYFSNLVNSKQRHVKKHINTSITGNNTTSITDSNMTHVTQKEDVMMKQVNIPQLRFCKPFRTKQELYEGNWRNRVAYKVLEDIDPHHEHIHVARFYEVTAGRHDMHAIGTDCTHYCPSPILWYPLWQEIFDIVERVYKRHSDGNGQLRGQQNTIP